MKHLILILIITSLIGCDSGKKPYVLSFNNSFSEKKWNLEELNKDFPADWTSSGYLTFDVKSSTTQKFEVRLYDEKGLRKLEILPFQNVPLRISIPVKHFQKMNSDGMDMAQIWKTPRHGYWIGFTGQVGSITKIDSIGIAMDKPIGSPVIEIGNFRLTSSSEDSIMTSSPLVDEFGQWIPAEWPGKAKSVEDLSRDWKAEEESMGNNDFKVSKYGGFLGTKAKATGFFRVENINGKWWFIDPEGYFFFSTGSCCIASGMDISRVHGREQIFAQFPPDFKIDDDRKQAPGKITSFYTWNLYRRFGDDWYEKWKDHTLKRLDSWGMNTIANWSDVSIGYSSKPYVVSLRGWGIEDGLMGMPDVYAPGYQEKVDSAANKQCTALKNDPFLLGYFIGNEPPWPEREGELAEKILTGNKSVMKDSLEKYLSTEDTPERRKAFVYRTYSKFIQIVNSAIKKYDPNHLNLGFRFGGYAPEEIIRASKGFDVFSFNHYGYDVDHSMIQRIYDITGLPMVIGEFHFGVPGRGLAPGLAQTVNYKERGEAYRYYVENVAAHPAMIGAHWFQWIDQPGTGRFDGENYNIGMIDVTDRPYPDLTAASKETFKQIPDVHSGKIKPYSRKALMY